MAIAASLLAHASLFTVLVWQLGHQKTLAEAPTISVQLVRPPRRERPPEAARPPAPEKAEATPLNPTLPPERPAAAPPTAIAPAPPPGGRVDGVQQALRGRLGCANAGEGDGAQSVAEAVYACGAQRLGHATRLIEDPALTEYVAERRIALEICLTSNVQTRATASYETHPLRRYFDAGANVVLNTDNRLMSGITLTDEYVHAAEELDFSFDELCTIALNGFESAFLPPDERDALVANARAQIQELRGASA